MGSKTPPPNGSDLPAEPVASRADAAALSLDQFRLIVTGHDAAGASLVVSVAAPTHSHRFGGAAGPLFHELWRTGHAPVSIDACCSSGVDETLVLAPPAGGTLLRIVDIPPEDVDDAVAIAAALPDAFASAGAPDALVASEESARHFTMHRTETLDYGIVLQGEITLILDRAETVARAGDVIVQCGTSHGWANRSGKPCRIAFVLVGATPSPDLRRRLAVQ